MVDLEKKSLCCCVLSLYNLNSSNFPTITYKGEREREERRGEERKEKRREKRREENEVKQQ